MGKVITIASQKGGVGKTATVLNLGYSLSRLGQKVLMIDADPQAGMTIASNLRNETRLGLYQLLRGQAQAKDAVISSKDGTMAFLGPGEMEAEDVLFYEKEALRGNLSKMIRSQAKGYDYVLIDSATGLGVIPNACLAVSQGAILCVSATTLALKSLSSSLKLIKRIRLRINQELRLDGVVFTMLDYTNPAEVELVNSVREAFPEEVFFDSIIPWDPGFEVANARGITLAMTAQAQAGSRAYLDLAVELRMRELQENLKGNENGEADRLF